MKNQNRELSEILLPLKISFKNFNSIKSGFTLIELLVVITVLGVLATIVLLAVNPGAQLARARDTSRIAAVTQLGRALLAYYTVAGGSLAGVPNGASGIATGSDWMGPIIKSNDLKVRPANPGWGTAPAAASNCDVGYKETSVSPGPANGNAGGYCYQVNLTTSANDAIVYVRLESNLYNNKCPSGQIAFGVFSTADARFGVTCLLPGATSTDAIPGTQTTPSYAWSKSWVGVNVWALAAANNVYNCGGQPALDSTFTHLKQAKVAVVRFFAFQSYAINPSGTRDWTAIDRVFASAQAHGIGLIPVLGNNWTDCDFWPISLWPFGGQRKDTTNWYAGAYLIPYDGYLTGYRQWVRYLVSQYSGNPMLVAWEEINEPQATSYGAVDKATLKAFTQDIASAIRSADPTTPVSLGSIGTGQPGFDGPSYTDMLTTADMATAHDYGYPTDPLPISPSCTWNCIRADLLDAGAAGKPFFIGEAGDQSCDTSTKAANYAAKMHAAFTAGAVGYLLWAYNDNAPAGNCGYDFGPNGQLIKIFTQF